jgi:hypothetical protein
MRDVDVGLEGLRRPPVALLHPRERHGAVDSVPDVPILLGGGTGPEADLPSFGGGGRFGGGGVSGDFDGPATNAPAALISSTSGTADSASGGGKSIGDAVSGALDVDDKAIILIAIGVLLAAIFGSTIYLIYIAPHILSEAAFNFLLGSSLIKSYRRMNHPDWMGSVFKDTCKPFLAVLVVALAAALAVHRLAPEITKISELFTR